MNLEESNYTYRQNEAINAIVNPRLKYISNAFETIYKQYWLASGTLLGKNLNLYFIFITLKHVKGYRKY